MKLHAGHAIVAAMAAFILIMTQFMVRAYHNQETLVAEDYYAKELRYQEQIDKLQNASRLGEKVRFEMTPGSLEIRFPADVNGKLVSGELFLMRSDDARADRRVTVSVPEGTSFTVPTKDMLPGVYSVQLEWTADGVAYLAEDRIYVSVAQ